MKIIAAKEEDKRPKRNKISAEVHLINAYWALRDSLKLINGCLYRHWEELVTSSSAFLLHSNGMVEWFNRTLEEYLRKVAS